MNIRVTATIRGEVQGVNFRHHTHQQAVCRNVTGWVRNLPNGDVQGCFEGSEPDVTALVDWCRTGPTWARVDSVQVERGDFQGEFDSFSIRS